jgi:hypothetical protein
MAIDSTLMSLQKPISARETMVNETRAQQDCLSCRVLGMHHQIFLDVTGMFLEELLMINIRYWRVHGSRRIQLHLRHDVHQRQQAEDHPV